MLFDTHAHLNDEKFDLDRNEIIKKIKDANVSYLVNPGVDVSSSLASIKLAKENDFIYAAVGVHPHEVKDMTDDTILVLKNLAKNEKVVAIGEIGLDYFYDFSPRDVQKHWFIKQIELAKSLNLPIIIHDRDSHADVLSIIQNHKPKELGCVLHCYASSVEMAKQYVKMGCMLSFGGPITFKNSKKSVEVVKEISLDNLMIETDSPYLTPVPFRGKRNDSSYVQHVAAKMAQIKGVSYEEVVRKTTENALKFFKIQK